MSTTVAELAETLQAVFTTEADHAAADAGFIRRVRKLTGASFVQTLVFGWLQHPQGSLEDLCAVAAADLDLDITPQSLDERFTQEAADCLQRTLAAALERLVAATPAAAAVLQRFTGVYAQDSTRWTLPAVLAALFPGCGARVADSAAAALKVVFRLEVVRGTLEALEVQPGRIQDLKASLAWAPLPEGSLLLEDLGFFDLDRLQHYAEQGVFFLSRLKAQTRIWHGGRCQSLVELLRQQRGDRLDLPVEVGRTTRLAWRLLAVRVPPAVAAKRRARLRKETRRQQRRPSAERLALCDWDVLITNAPAEKLSLAEAWSLRRLRWQLELLIKVCKSEGHLDETRGTRVWRVVCEAYAKLLAMLVQHWVTLVGGGSPLVCSARRAARVVRQAAAGLARRLGRLGRLTRRLTRLAATLRRRCRIYRRRGRPSALELVQDPSRDPCNQPLAALS